MAITKFQRSIAAKTASFDPIARTIEGTFSSTTPVQRTFIDASGLAFEGWEVLGHREEDIDFSVMDIGACLCFQHDLNDVRGVIEAFSIERDKRLHGLIRFAPTAKGEETMQLIGAGIMRQLSIGYKHTATRHIGELDGLPVIYVSWRPHEVSTVTVGADVMVAGVGRSATDTQKTAIDAILTRALVEPVEVPAEVTPAAVETIEIINPDVARNEVATEVSQDNAQVAGTAPELERVATLKSLGRALDAEEFAAKCILEGSTPEQFTSGLEDFKREMSTAKTITKGSKKMEKFDLGRAFQNLHTGKSEGYEGEVAQELSIKLRSAGLTTSPNALLLPMNVLKRSQTMGVATSGGNLLVPEQLNGHFVTKMHPAYVMDRLGITQLNLSKSARFSKMEGTPYFLWSAAGATNTRASRETAALTKTAFTTSTDVLTPVRGGTYFEFSDQLGMELDPSFIEMCKQDLSVTIALEEQRVLFKGNGVNEPRGLDNRAIQTVAGVGPIPTRTELLSIQKKIAAVNGIPGVWLMSATMLYTLMGVAVGTAGKFLIEDSMTLLGTEVVVSNQIPDGEIWCAQWDTVLWADFGALQIEIVRDADLALHGMNRYQVSLFADTNVKREALVVKGVFA